MRVEAFAKVNLSLQVRPVDKTGRHSIRSLAHSVDWHDDVEFTEAEEDRFEVVGEHEVPRGGSNLALRALEAVRRRARNRRPVGLRLGKSIPVAAGLGGGSADAAAVLAVAGRIYGLDAGAITELAEPLGADVPFCLTGGAAWMEGYGQLLEPLPPCAGFALAVVVPPFLLETAAVYRRWDDLDGPAGPAVDRRALPDALREYAPLSNDLTPAALALAPNLGDWIADLRRRWDCPVLMSGSGSALFGFFSGYDEAAEAVAGVGGMRAGRACRPVPFGRREGVGGTLA